MNRDELWIERAKLARDGMTQAKDRALEARERQAKVMAEQDDIVWRVVGLIEEIMAIYEAASDEIEVFQRDDFEGIWFRWRGLYWKLRMNGAGLEANEEAFVGKAEAAWSISARQWPVAVKAALDELWRSMADGGAVGGGAANNARRLLARLQEEGGGDDG